MVLGKRSTPARSVAGKRMPENAGEEEPVRVGEHWFGVFSLRLLLGMGQFRLASS